MKRALVPLALVAVLAGTLLWVLPGDRRAPARSPQPGGAAPAKSPTSPAADPPTALAAPDDAAALLAAEGERSVARPSGLGPEGGESFTLEDAVWVDVRVALPEGVPADDERWIVALVGEGVPYAGRDLVRVAELLVDGETPDLPGIAAFALRPLGADDTARVPLPPWPPSQDAAEGGASQEPAQACLLLVSRYAYAPPASLGPSDPASVVLEARLGAYVTGRLLLADGAGGASRPPEDFQVVVVSDAPAEIAGDPMSVMRMGHVDAELGFAVRALPPTGDGLVIVHAEGLLDHGAKGLVARAGEHVRHDVTLRAGASLSGRVVDDAGEGVAGARVVAYSRGVSMGFGGDSEEQRTDAGGAFRLQGLPGHVPLVLHASADGYLEAEQTLGPVGELGELGDLRLVLETGAELAGRVTWPDGTPAAGCSVSARPTNGWPESRTRAADDGSFVLGGLDGTSFEVRAQPEGTVTSEFHGVESGEQVAVATVVDEDPQGQQARKGHAFARDVAAGTRDLLLVLEEALEVRGRVVDDRGRPIAAFHVVASPARRGTGPPSASRSFRSEDGRFALAGVYPGEWSLRAQADGHWSPPDAETRVTIPQEGDPLVLRLSRAASFSGVVVDPSGAPVAEAAVRAASSRSSFGSVGEQEHVTDARGAFTLEDCAPSGLWLSAWSPEWAPSEPLALLAEPGTQLSDLVLRLHAGVTVTGEVYDDDGTPDAGARVAVGPQAFDSEVGLRETVTDGSGRFRVEHAAPGRIRVMAMPGEHELMGAMVDAEPGEGMGPFGVGKLRTATVEAADGEEVHVVLGSEPRRPVRVSGRIQERARAVPDVQIMVFPLEGSLMEGMRIVRSDAQGRFRLSLDHSGAYRFQAALDERPVSFLVEVPAVSEHEVLLELPQGVLRGRVLDPEGTPLEGVAVHLAEASGGTDFFRFDPTRSATSDAAGAFSFGHVRPGEYVLRAGSGEPGRSPGPWGARVLAGIVLADEGQVVEVELRLARAGKLSGVVRDESGAPVAGAWVFVRDGSGELLSPLASVATDAAGAFVHGGVPAGDVHVFARSSEGASAEVGPLAVRAGDETEVALVLSAGGTLVVSVEADDEPVRADVRVEDEAGRLVSGAWSTEALERALLDGTVAGETRVGPLPPGRYEVRAVAPDGREARRSVTLRPGREERRVRLRLR